MDLFGHDVRVRVYEYGRHLTQLLLPTQQRHVTLINSILYLVTDRRYVYILRDVQLHSVRSR